MPKLAKSQLKEYAVKAHDAELRAAYGDLAASFEKWQRGELTSLDLNERINRIQSGPIREICNLHMGLTQEMRIARAIARGLLVTEELPVDLLPTVLPHVAYYESMLTQHGTANVEGETPAVAVGKPPSTRRST